MQEYWQLRLRGKSAGIYNVGSFDLPNRKEALCRK
jgi:hypothetical protein